jgi:hypothetical protein
LLNGGFAFWQERFKNFTHYISLLHLDYKDVDEGDIEGIRDICNDMTTKIAVITTKIAE